MSTFVIERIRAWQDAGLIDPATAQRLIDAESASGVEPHGIAGPPAGPDARDQAVARGPFVTAPELFAYLGAVFLLGAWYAFVASQAIGADALWLGGGAMVAAIALGAAALALARRGDHRSRRAAGVSLLVAYPNLGFAVNELLGQLFGPFDGIDPGVLAVSTLVVVVAAVIGRQLLPSLLTQFGLSVACIAAGAAGLAWLQSVLFPPIDEPYGTTPDTTLELVKAVGTIAWWILVAVAMALLLVLADRGPGVEGRRRVGRVFTGFTLVGGTASGVLATYPWWAADDLAGQPVLPAPVGAGLLVIVGVGLTWLALRRSAVDYLWPGGFAVWSALTYLNAQYLAVESGLWVGLLVEGLALLAIGLVVRRLAARIATPAGTATPTAPAPM